MTCIKYINHDSILYLKISDILNKPNSQNANNEYLLICPILQKQ